MTSVAWPEAVRLEVLPVEGIVERVVAALPRDLHLTVTCSPRLGVDRTVSVAEDLVSAGYRVTPHLAASMVADRLHVERIARRLDAARVTDVFVVGGDAKEPAGDYRSAAALLDHLTSTPTPPSEIGIAGYPDGHPLICDDDLYKALVDKARFATYLVTQMCFDTAAINRWVTTIGQLGVDVPVHLGVPGPVQRKKLVEISARIGVGGSVRFMTKNRRAMTQLLLRRRYCPERLVTEASRLEPLAKRIGGLHVFTFNQLTEAEVWLRARGGTQ